jgi:hypothetical protein
MRGLHYTSWQEIVLLLYRSRWQAHFRKKPELVFSAPKTDRTNSGGVSTILPTTTYTPNSVCTSQTDDGTAAPHASLPHITVLSNSPKSSCMVPMPEASCDASQTDSQKIINWF